MSMRSFAIIAAMALSPAVLSAPGHARSPLIPHRIRDMLLVGKEGASGSTVTRRAIAIDGWLYLSGEPGLQTIDIRDPGSLRLADDWTRSSPKMNGAATRGGVLYVANWSPGEGLALFDLTSPGAPAHRRTVSTLAHTWEVDVVGNLLDVAIDDGTTTGIATYDVADPWSPDLLVFLSMGDRLVGNAVRHGRYLYVTHKRWLRVYEASDPARPAGVGEVEFPGLGGEARIHRGYLYVLSRTTAQGEHGGLRVYSLGDPSRPREVFFWEHEEPRDLHFQGDLLVVPASGSGIYTLDVSDPARPEPIHHWYASWPEMGHGGYPVCVAGAGDHVYIGTTSGNDPECESFDDCSHFGARIYSVQVFDSGEEDAERFEFDDGVEGWSLAGWKAGPYELGQAYWDGSAGNPDGCVEFRGSGATNNQDSCNREGAEMVRTVSTEGRRGIRIELDVSASLDAPPGSSGVGSCSVLGGTTEDKLVVSVSSTGPAGPWSAVEELTEGGGLPSGWRRVTIDLSDLPEAEDNPRLALRLQWQFNTAEDLGRIDNVRVTGSALPEPSTFRRGDSNGDGALDISDPVRTLGCLFEGGRLSCLDAADANDSGAVDISDAVYSLAFSFLGGPSPPPPFPRCGADPTYDGLSCDAPCP